MKSLKPSMKENKRYLLLKTDLSRDKIEEVILNFIGVLGMSRSGMEFIRNKKNETIIAVNRESLNEIRASFAVSPEKINVTRVSGTLKALEEKSQKGKRL